MIKRYCFILALALLVLCFCFAGCIKNDNTSAVPTDTEDSNTEQGTNTDTGTDQGTETDQAPPDSGDKPKYYVASVEANECVIATPYTADIELSDELKGIYYSTIAPGGEPSSENGCKIWLTLKPIRDNYVHRVTVEGKFYMVEHLGRDIYCISGVESDLTVKTVTKTASSVPREIFTSYGYGISDDGKMTVTWEESDQDPIRYIEISYNDGEQDRVEYVDAQSGSAELFSMNEGQIYELSMCAIGTRLRGKAVEIKGCYMPSPKNVPFPRVEIITENCVWPSCDFVGSPEDCWGAGITNAEYERCIVTLYNEQNEVVYASSSDNDYTGAKMKIRGNTSARYAPKGRYPYKIKLDEKADLLAPFLNRDGKAGYEDKEWLLLNYGNDGYRICGDAIADAVGTEWSPDYCYVSLYVNGEYRGLYVLSESVKRGNGTENEQWRVNVDDDGFVFECDAYWWNEELSFSTPLTEGTPMHFTFKYPDADGLTSESAELKYLQEYLTEFEAALMKNDDSYLEYIDLDSFVKWLLVSDFLCINDGGGCNIFLYKKDSSSKSKIAMGPNWDFDSYMGNTYGLSTIRLKWDGAPFYYQYLIEKESFQKRYKELFWELCDSLEAYVEAAFAQINEEAHTALLAYDNERFGTSTKTLTVRKNNFINWLKEHIEWMKLQFA